MKPFQVNREALRAVLLALGYKKAAEADDARMKTQIGLALQKIENDDSILDPLSDEQKGLLDRIMQVVEAAGDIDDVEFEMVAESVKKPAKAAPPDEDEDEDDEPEPAKKPAKQSRVIDDGDDEDDDEPEPAKKPVKAPASQPEESDEDEPAKTSAPAVPAKRGRGRPRKDEAASPTGQEAPKPVKQPDAPQPEGSQVLYGFSPGRNRAYLAGVVVSKFGDKIAEQGGITEFEADYLASLVGEDRGPEHFQHLAGAMHVRRGMVFADAFVIETRYAKTSGHRFTAAGKAAAKDAMASK